MPHDDRLPFHRRNLPPGVGAKLMDARTEAGRSRRDVTAGAGIAMRTLARIERDQQKPIWPTRKRLCEELGISDYAVAPRWSNDADYVPTDPAIAPGVGLRALRRQRGIAMAELADASGVSVSTFSRFERGLLVSRRLSRPLDAGGGLRSEADFVLHNDAVAAAFGFANSEELERACMAAVQSQEPAADQRDPAGIVASVAPLSLPPDGRCRRSRSEGR